MLKTMFSLVDREQAIHVKVHEGLVDVAMAALSAEPDAIEEWRVAMKRFVGRPVVDAMMARSQEGVARCQAEGGQVIIDMTARLLVIDTPLPDMPRVGNVQTCDNDSLLDLWLPYRIPNDWEITYTFRDWEGHAKPRRARLERKQRVDERQILFGQLPSWIVRHWLEDAAPLEEPTQHLQESWLLTPHRDLLGLSPRQVLLAKHEFINGDLQDQGENWSLTGRCPPGLAATSHAYRYGGFGTHEIILYHEMTVHLLLECERRLRGVQECQVQEEVRHLEQLQQEWLHQPHQALYNQSPAAMIARERARLPAVVPPGQSEEHDDCPVCRMMHDSGQPLIWQLDGFALDHCFATSFYETVDQWRDAQDAWEAMRHHVEQRRREATSQETESGKRSVWQRSHTNMSFFDDMPALEACAVMMFSIGGHMAELIQDLKTHEDSLDRCRELHESFDDLRIVFKEQEDTWMVQNAIGAFTIVLQQLANRFPELAEKCCDLDDKLEFLLRRYEEHNDPYSASDQLDG